MERKIREILSEMSIQYSNVSDIEFLEEFEMKLQELKPEEERYNIRNFANIVHKEIERQEFKYTADDLHQAVLEGFNAAIKTLQDATITQITESELEKENKTKIKTVH